MFWDAGQSESGCGGEKILQQIQAPLLLQRALLIACATRWMPSRSTLTSTNRVIVTVKTCPIPLVGKYLKCDKVTVFAGSPHCRMSLW